MFDKQNAEIAQFYEEVDDKSATLLAPYNRFNVEQFDDSGFLLLERIKSCQKEISQSESHVAMEHKNILRKRMLSG